MDLPLSEEQRKEITIAELSRLIFRVIRERSARSDMWSISSRNLLNDFYNESAGPRMTKPQEPVRGEDFFLKFSEAIALLKRRGLLMDKIDTDTTYPPFIYLTSAGRKSSLDDYGTLILIDGAQEIVDSLKGQIPNGLDPVVEQYYLESLRACQEGLYISSVICLGAASERTIDCLVQAVAEKYPERSRKIEELYSTSAQIHYLSDKDNFKQVFGSIKDDIFRGEIKDRLSGIAQIYRRNRNEAGHPGPVPMDITRDEQESHLNSFRRYAAVVFKAIEALKQSS